MQKGRAYAIGRTIIWIMAALGVLVVIGRASVSMGSSQAFTRTTAPSSTQDR